ncbi:hypothetical protein M942_09315 [Enterobacter ludwigii]|uniref:Ail/Lom family outer membrane beta-barrel protein n=1 Tax=Enterobacter TaxID=547 RepID=UPI0003D8136C|nr:Ail/Lom family outer membrane beta-barrel protein [Enterobacter ludwigii]AHE72816.1 hypothetical protein M942_09315 [Enterobacter ludwigii]KLP39035.1 hypothetical protein ABR36_11485 [Enterobacter ludwigii]HDR2587495.1 outer membrane beta-barrel protein [Enterobacter ludwigii]HDR2599150.1 outer membrane beta-barrel protein [Enterobacter ludwigii]
MKSKVSLLVVLVLFPIIFLSPAYAGTLESSIGYSFGNSGDINSPKGFNVKYGYRWDDALGVITSFTYMHSDNDSFSTDNNIKLKNEQTTSYYSFGVGPSYKVSDYIGVYGLLGLSHISNEYKSTYLSSGDSYWHKDNNSTNFMYGMGLNFYLPYDIMVNAGYERTSFDTINSDNNHLNTFNINIGYKW